MRIKNEERPDASSASQNETKSSIGLENPEYAYREFSKEQAMKDLNRPGKFKDKYGYEKVIETETRTVMACPRSEHEERVAKSQKASDEAAYGTAGNTEAMPGYEVHVDTMEFEKTELDD